MNAIASDSRYELGSKEVGKWEVGSGFLKLDWELIILLKTDLVWLFGWCYAIDGGYKGCNPYIERHLAIFVNCF